VLLLGAGEIFSGFSTGNLGGLFVTTGVIMGVGASLQFMVISWDPQPFSTDLTYDRLFPQSQPNTSTRSAAWQTVSFTPVVV
jgi:hypothetical protein